MGELQSQLSLKEAELAAIPDTPENAEARALLQSEINSLNIQISALEAQQAREALQIRINALGDICLLIGHLFENNAANLRPADSWNPCAFCVDHINTDFGWIFEVLPKPTIEDLELIHSELNP